MYLKGTEGGFTIVSFFFFFKVSALGKWKGVSVAYHQVLTRTKGKFFDSLEQVFR